jgi:hypothetical protein
MNLSHSYWQDSNPEAAPLTLALNLGTTPQQPKYNQYKHPLLSSISKLLVKLTVFINLNFNVKNK